jgi:hypothetical protein
MGFGRVYSIASLVKDELVVAIEHVDLWKSSGSYDI